MKIITWSSERQWQSGYLIVQEIKKRIESLDKHNSSDTNAVKENLKDLLSWITDGQVAFKSDTEELNEVRIILKRLEELVSDKDLADIPQLKDKIQQRKKEEKAILERMGNLV